MADLRDDRLKSGEHLTLEQVEQKIVDCLQLAGTRLGFDTMLGSYDPAFTSIV